MTEHVVVTQIIRAPAKAVWQLVSDLPRMPEWSPENVGADWLAGATQAAVGARFRGANRSDRRSWKTDGEITECDPPRRLAFEIKAGPFRVAQWAYTVEPTPDGCSVTEAWTDRRGQLLRMLSKPVTGIADRAAHNRRGMEQTLASLAAAAEKLAAGSKTEPEG